MSFNDVTDFCPKAFCASLDGDVYSLLSNFLTLKPKKSNPSYMFVMVVFSSDKARPTYLYDGSLVMGNLMNAAHSLGIGSCWIHRAKEEFESEEGKALLKKWGIEGDYEGIGHCVLGYAAAELPAAKPRKENYVYYVEA